MADNNKIFIDVQVSADGEQQIYQFSKAFDGLRGSISGLANPIATLDKEVSALGNSLNELNDKNKDVASYNDKVKKSLEEGTSTFKLLKETIDIVKGSVASLEGALTAGLSILLVYGPEIFKFITSLGQGKDAIDKAKLSLSTLNGALQSSDYSNAIKQVSELKINVKLAAQGLLDKKEVLAQYNSTVGKTMGQVSDFNKLEDKVINGGPAYIKMTLLKAQAQLALQEAAKKAYQAQLDAQKSDDDSLTFWDKTKDFAKRAIFAAAIGPAGLAYADIDKSALAKKRRAEMVKDDKKQKDILLEQAKDFQTQAAVIAKKNGADLLGGKTLPSRKSKPKTEKRDPQLDLQLMSLNFAQTIKLEKQNYTEELKVLDDQLAKKLISQQQYQEKSKLLQEKYHQNIGAGIEEFNKTDLDKARQHLQDLAEIARLEEAIKKDSKTAQNAVLPASKLAAETQFITDKYTREILLAKGNAEKIKELEENKLRDIANLNKQYSQQRKDFELQTAQQVSNAAFSILQNNIKSNSQAKLKQLDTEKQAELSNTSLTSAQKQAIEAKYKKKEAEEKTKAFKSEQRASMLQAVINGALAITKATAQTGVFAAFAIPAIIAETAIQVATIAAQKTPQYAKGGLHYQSDGRGALLSGYSRTDNTNAYLRSGEAVIVSEAMRNPWARNLVSAINVAHGGRDFSATNPGRGYAIGGIFTDGGNSNRYYNQPMNDVKDLANTLAYQMINNFPPVYVDVKDINSQQSILAQTVNRVNL
jgi:hypothetical protein